MNRHYCELPKIVHDWLWLYKAWIVGSGVDWYISDDKTFPKDLDIIIPPKEWNYACKLIDKTVSLRTNSFGGFILVSNNIKIDFWPMNLEDFVEVSLNTTNKNQVQALRLNPYNLVIAKK